MTKNFFFTICQQNKKRLLPMAGLTALSGITLLVIDYFLTAIMQSAMQKTPIAETAPFFVVLFLFFILRTLCNFQRKQDENKLSQSVRLHLRKRLHERLCQKKLNIEAGKLSTLFVETIDALDEYFTTVLPEVLDVIILIPLILLTALYCDTLTALLYLITLPIAPFLLYLIGRVTKKASEAQWQRLLQLTNGFYELLHGMVTLKIFRQTERQYQRLCQLTEDFADTSLKVLQIAFVSSFALELITTLSIAIVAVSIGLRLLSDNITFTTAFFLLLITPEFYQPLRNGGLSFHAFMTAHTAEQELHNVLTTTKATANTAKVSSHDEKQVAIHCQNLSFCYPQTNDNVIANFSLTIPKNKVIILCGESGSGKSTLLKLLAGLIQPTKGTIYYASNTTISYVPQQPHLFSATLRDNITLFAKTTDTEVLNALNLADLANWAKRLPHGLDTKLGDGGLPLSRGQLQRLGLARAFCQNRSLVLLDEPTAGLDLSTEQQVLTALTKFAKGRTLIIASHRHAVINWGAKVITIAPPVIGKANKEV